MAVDDIASAAPITMADASVCESASAISANSSSDSKYCVAPKPSTSRRIRFAAMLRRCNVALAASGYLAKLAEPYCDRVIIHPMAVDVPPLFRTR